MGDYDDEKPSWREIDKRRDKSRFYGREEAKGEKKEGTGDRWKAGRTKEALDRLFLGEKGTLEHDKFFKKLHSTYGTNRFLGAVQRYIAKYGLPDDVATLILVLDVKEESIRTSIIEKFEEIFPHITDRQKEDVRRKLSIVALSDGSSHVRVRAQDALEELGL